MTNIEGPRKAFQSKIYRSPFLDPTRVQPIKRLGDSETSPSSEFGKLQSEQIYWKVEAMTAAHSDVGPKKDQTIFSPFS